MALEDQDVLPGGVVGGRRVVRVGAEVRRPLRDSGPAVHALLARLREQRFEAPVFLGLDDDGRERVSYLPGKVGLPPYPAWVLEDGALVSTARLLRRLHDVTAAMPLPDDLPWDTTFASAAGRVVGHNDVCPENTVFREGRAVAFIDFDFAAPTEPLLDLAHLLRMWVPLGVPDGPGRPARLRTRLRCGAGAYGTTPGPRLQAALEQAVRQAEAFVRAELDRPDLTPAYFATRRDELVRAAAAD